MPIGIVRLHRRLVGSIGPLGSRAHDEEDKQGRRGRNGLGDPGIGLGGGKIYIVSCMEIWLDSLVPSRRR